MARLPWFAFYPSDWFRDTRCLTFAAKGAWMDLLGILWDSPTRGRKTLDMGGWALELGKPLAEVEAVFEELRKRNIADFIIESNGDVTVMSRRQMREEKSRESTRLRVQKHRDMECNGISNGYETPQKSEVIYQKSEERKKKNTPLTPPEGEVRELWEGFWADFPSRGGRKLYKQEAMRCFLALSLDEQRACRQAVVRYARHCVQTNREPMDPQRFIKRREGEPWREFTDDQTPNGKPVPLSCAWKVQQGVKTVPCGKAIAPNQHGPPRPFCEEHLKAREALDRQIGVTHAANHGHQV